MIKARASFNEKIFSFSKCSLEKFVVYTERAFKASDRRAEKLKQTYTNFQQ